MLREIGKELQVRMTDGFLTEDANGEKVHVFLDLVGVLGDTPGLNGILDVLGHNAHSCSHKCSFDIRSDGRLVNPYIANHGSWLRTATRRTSWRHLALRKMNAPENIMDILGVKTDSTDINFGLYELEIVIRSCKPRVKRSARFRDLLDIAFLSLKPREGRHRFEKFILSTQRRLRLRTQNNMYSHDNRHVLTMSISHLYAVVPFDVAGYRYARSGGQELSIEHANRIEAALQSCVELVGTMWQPHQRKHYDGQ